MFKYEIDKYEVFHQINTLESEFTMKKDLISFKNVKSIIKFIDKQNPAVYGIVEDVVEGDLTFLLEHDSTSDKVNLNKQVESATYKITKIDCKDEELKK